MRYGSVCSGIEAATVAWDQLGWTPVFFSEIEKFPCAVLAHHYPDVPNHGDMTKFQEWPLADIDVLVGGTPCQSFSVAGLRAGLADPRGNLMLTYLAIAQRYRPEWVVWENVPGVLSSNGGRDFGTFLAGLAECGYGWAYRVLDAQYFGLAQRRKRVFVVGSARGWAAAAAVLFERESLQGHPAPSRSAGQRTAATIAARFGNSRNNHEELAPVDVCGTMQSRSNAGGGFGTDFEAAGGLIPSTAHALRADGFDASEDGTGRGTPLVPTIVGALTAGMERNKMGAPEVDAGLYIPTWPAEIACTLNAAFADKQGLEDQHALNGASLFVLSTGQGNASLDRDIAPPLTAENENPIVGVIHEQ